MEDGQLLTQEELGHLKSCNHCFEGWGDCLIESGRRLEGTELRNHPSCMSLVISNWRCRCGIRIKLVAEMTATNPAATIAVACPMCEDERVVCADKVISVMAENSSGEVA
jgi:hypothetical protein